MSKLTPVPPLATAKVPSHPRLTAKASSNSSTVSSPPPPSSQLSSRSRPTARNSLEIYEQLLAAEDPDSNHMHRRGRSGLDEDEDDDEEEEDEEEEEVDQNYLQEAKAMEEAEELEKAQEAAGLDSNFALASKLSSLLAGDGAIADFSQLLVDDDFMFPVHRVHQLPDDEADEVLFAESGANTPRHARALSRRDSARSLHENTPDDFVVHHHQQHLPQGGSVHSPDESQFQWPSSHAQQPRQSSDVNGRAASPSLRNSSSLRRYSQLEPSRMAHAAGVPAGLGGGISPATSRPLSADIERRRSLGSSQSNLLAQAYPQTQNQSQFTSPSPPKRQPFHPFGNGPVSIRPQGSPPSVLPPVLPPARQVPILPALQQVSSRPSSPSPHHGRVERVEETPRSELVQSKNNFSHPAAQQQQPQPTQPPASTHTPRQPLPPRSDFPDFPGAPLPTAFSSAPSQPLALLSVPTMAGNTEFQLPAGYEIRRKFPSPSSFRRHNPWGRVMPDEQKQQQLTEEQKQLHQSPAFKKAMHDVLLRLGAAYGVRPTSSDGTSSSSIPEINETGKHERKVGDEGLEDASISFSDADVGATSRPHSATERDKPPQISAAAALPSGDATSQSRSSGGLGTTDATLKEKMKGVSSFILDAFDEIEAEGGTPRDGLTPAVSQRQLHTIASARSGEAEESTVFEPESKVEMSEMLMTGSMIDLPSESSRNTVLDDDDGGAPSARVSSLNRDDSIPVSYSVPINASAAPSLAPLGKQKAWTKEKESSTSTTSHHGVSKSRKPAKSKKASTSVITTPAPSSSGLNSALQSPTSSSSGGNGGSSGAGAKNFRPSVSVSIKEYVSNPSSGSTTNRNKKKASLERETSLPESSSALASQSNGSAAPSSSSSVPQSSHRDPASSIASSLQSSLGLNSSSASSASGAPKKKLKKKASVRLRKLMQVSGGTRLLNRFSKSAVRCLCAVARMDEVWCCEKDGVIVIRSASTGEMVHGGRLDQLIRFGQVMALQYAATSVWAGTDSGKLLRIDPETRAVITPDGSHVMPIETATSNVGSHSLTSPIKTLAFNGINRLFTAQDKVLRSWDTKTGKVLRATFPGHTSEIKALLCMGSSLVWSATADGSIRLFNSESGELLQTLMGHRDAVNSLLASGMSVLSGSSDGFIRVWRKRTGGLSAESTQHQLLNNNHVSPHQASSPAIAHDPNTSHWECVQEVAHEGGRIASLLLLNSNTLWSVGQAARILAWSISSTSGLLSRMKDPPCDGGHSSFISGLSLVRRTEVKSVWSHSLSSSGSSGEGELCVWSHVTHNGKDQSEQILEARLKNLGLRVQLQWLYQRCRSQAQDAVVYQDELQKILLLAAEHRAHTLEAEEHGAHLLSQLNDLRAEHKSLHVKCEEIETKKLEQSELHEEYALNLKKLLKESNNTKEQYREKLEALQQDYSQLDENHEELTTSHREAENRAEKAEGQVADLEQLVEQLRAESLQKQEALEQAQQLLAEKTALVQEMEDDTASLRTALSIAQEAAAKKSPTMKPAAAAATAGGVLDSAKMDMLARELFQLSTNLDRLRKNLTENVAKPLKGLTKDSVFKVQSELITASTILHTDVSDAANQVKGMMNSYLSDVQKLHVGISGSSSSSSAGHHFSQAELDERQLQRAVENSYKVQ